MTVEKYFIYLTEWLKQKTLAAGAQGLVVGVSGGVDSAVTAVIAQAAFPKKTLALILPFKKSEDMDDALNLVREFQIKFKVLSLHKTYNQLLKTLHLKPSKKTTNIVPRLRMATLYAIAQKNNYLVVGTSNFCEWQTGYFTKYGDVASDLAPLLHLTKSNVLQLARHLKIPVQIINKLPSAGF